MVVTGYGGAFAAKVASVVLLLRGLCFNLSANFIPATGASEREAGQRRRGHTWRA